MLRWGSVYHEKQWRVTNDGKPILNDLREMCRTMKEVILSSDNEAKIYLVPDTVADHLEDYCLDFSVEWIWESPEAAKYRRKSRTNTKTARSSTSESGWQRVLFLVKGGISRIGEDWLR